MKFKIGQIIQHKLTKQQFLIIGFLWGEYKCRDKNYQLKWFGESELETQ